jgi:hypothetical protein
MDWGEGSMNWAELRDLVQALPADSVTKAALAGDVDGRRWTQTDYGTAAMYNVLLVIVRILWTAHLKGNPPTMRPIDPPRTEEDAAAEEARAAKAARNAALLEQMRPQQSKTAEQRAAETAEWLAKVRALEAAQAN